MMNLQAETDNAEIGLSPIQFKRERELTYQQLADLLGIGYNTAIAICKDYKPKERNWKYWLACAYLDQLLSNGKLKLICNRKAC